MKKIFIAAAVAALSAGLVFVACNKETEIFKSDKFSVSNTFIDTNVLKAYYPVIADDKIYFIGKGMHIMMATFKSQMQLLLNN